MIEIQDLGFSYGIAPFIESVDTSFCDGSLTVIIGENGSGKSTLLNLISGELKAKTGNILIDGKNIKKFTRRRIARALSCFPQGRNVPDMTALELVTLGRFAHIASTLATPKSEEEIAKSALEYVGASHFAYANLKRMSYGERQRIYLAMQIAQNAKNCLLDEPTNFLDVGAKFSMMEVLVRMKNEGKCVVCVLHDLSLALQYADRVILMKKGEIFADGTPAELYENGKIAEAFDITLERIVSNGEISYIAKPKQKAAWS